MQFLTRAPAKINLTLHVVRRRDDGFHDLESLVIFAGVADVLALDPGAPLGLVVSGPTATDAGDADGNLVLKAARALAERVPGLRLGAFRLLKRLPVGAGIGGGSSDAAAALRLLARANGLSIDDERVHAAACDTGSDVPVCVHPRSRMMAGTGDRLGTPLMARPLYAVLANPRVHVPTPAVFKAMGFAPGESRDLGEHPLPHDGLDHPGFVDLVRGGRNDMQAAALSIAPAIGDAVDVLGATVGHRVVRMSGSGSTCFALYDDRRAARAAAARVAEARPDWWVKATALR
ncbi:4-(cytidine 5'-diphospho)-2-C-methyl-D-erythritol kinase [Lichenibacterium dinghuense]|uniref:4-(cytidine 5'-diphospho)-2-C-methyl-D-erythritol kinase n=1 Tax=Lichenibacterium dinghuense TaxID=2895977 RepID=UPI001F017D3F|nr:4-(cytidine 5'-diphospho)-2-C-methyl-D-erythritol kinase [Lichenibacterium sp. 6Y81]